MPLRKLGSSGIDNADYYHHKSACYVILQLFQSTLVVQLLDTGHVPILHSYTAPLFLSSLSLFMLFCPGAPLGPVPGDPIVPSCPLFPFIPSYPISPFVPVGPGPPLSPFIPFKMNIH